MSIEELDVEIKNIKDTISDLDSRLSDIMKKIEKQGNIDLTNKTIKHKKYNIGKVICQNDDIAEIEFENGVKTSFSISVILKSNIISCDDEEVTKTLNYITELNEQKDTIQNQIELNQNRIKQLESEKINILKNADYEYEEVGDKIFIDFDDEQAEDYTEEMKEKFEDKYKYSVKKVLKYKRLFKVFFNEGYTAFGQSMRYARRISEVMWYSRVATEEKEQHKTYYDYIVGFKQNHIIFDGKHIPIFIDVPK